MDWNKRRGRLLSVGLCAIGALASAAQGQLPGEYQVKAAFVYNFAKFVEWPAARFADPAAPLRLCVLGEDPFGADLDQTVVGKTVNGRPIAIRRDDRVENLHGCHILFISASEQNRLPAIFATLKGEAVLTVGDVAPFARLGGVINLTLDEDRVRFEVNVDAAERAGVKVSSQLLKLAKVIRGGGPGARN